MRIARGPSLEIYNAPAFQSSKDGCICRLIEAGTLIGYRCACHPAREGKGQALANQLSNSEKAVCARIGINESEYLAQKSAAGPLTVQINPALRDERRAGHRAAMQSLPVPEREIAVAMNTDPRDYSARRGSRRPVRCAHFADFLVGSAFGSAGGMAAMGRFASGIDGRAIIEEARLEHRDAIDDESTNTEDLVAEAREALDVFDVADEEGWRKLAFAAACIQGALERHAPPYANREPYGEAEAERRRRAGK